MDGREVPAYLANSGRLNDLLVPGARALLIKRSQRRRTEYDLAIVYYGNIPVSVDARLPSLLVKEALYRGLLPEFLQFARISQEVRFGKRRLDLLLTNSTKCYVETKSVTLVRDGVALFPDAPTQRGRSHLDVLCQARAEGHRAAMIFVAQRADAHTFSPNDPVDPEFGRKLREAARDGLEVYALSCRVTAKEVEADRRLPVNL